MERRTRPQYDKGINLSNRLVAIDTQIGVTYIGLSETASNQTTIHNYIVTPTDSLVKAARGYRIAAVNEWKTRTTERSGEEDVKVSLPLAIHALLPPVRWQKEHCLD